MLLNLFYNGSIWFLVIFEYINSSICWLRRPRLFMTFLRINNLSISMLCICMLCFIILAVWSNCMKWKLEFFALFTFFVGCILEFLFLSGTTSIETLFVINQNKVLWFGVDVVNTVLREIVIDYFRYLGLIF